MKNPSTLLVVNNLKVSRAFYVDILGVDVIEELENAIKLQIGNHQIFMFQGSKGSIDYQHGYNANSTLIFSVQNLDEKINELRAKGIKFVHERPNENKWGRYAAFKDPSGIVHELMEFY